MKRNTLKTRTRTAKLTRKIRYKDIAIAIALSTASLLFVPTAAKAATTDTTTDTGTTAAAPAVTTTDTTGTTTTGTTGTDTTGTATTGTTGTDTTGTATTGTTGTDTTGTATTGTTGTDTTGTATTGTGTGTTATGTGTDTTGTGTTATGTGTTGAGTTGTDTTGTATTGTDTTGTGTTAAGTGTTSTGTTGTSTTGTSTTGTTSSSTTTGSTTGSITLTPPVLSTVDAPATVPSNGIAETDLPAAPSATGTYTICVQAVGVDGKPLSSQVVVTTDAAANSSTPITLTPAILAQLTSAFPNAANYVAVDPTSLTTAIPVSVTDSNVLVSVYYALKQVTATFTFIDETTGKTLCTETNTYTYDSPTNGTTFKTEGIKAPQATLASGQYVLTASDLSDTPQTNTAELPYFGPTGQIFNNSFYVLDSAKSDGLTPTTFVGWPATATCAATFYYTETPSATPTVAMCAIDPSGNIIKSFSSQSPTATFPVQQVDGASYLPSAADASISGYTMTGVVATLSGSQSGLADVTKDYTFTPEQYSAFLASPAASSLYDVRSLGDYSSLALRFTYTGNPIKLYVQPVDQDGNKIGSPIEYGSGIVGESETITSPAVSGFEPVDESLSLSVAPDQGTIEIPYKKSAASSTGSSSSSTGSTTTPGSSSSTTASGSSSSAAAKPAASSEASTSSSLLSAKASSSQASPAPIASSSSSSSSETAKTMSASGLLAGSSSSSTGKLPQTGNSVMGALSAVGIALMGILGLCYKKIKRFFNN